MNLAKIIVIACLLILPTLAGAWNIPGHMVTGAMAYRILKQKSPKTVAKVIALLKQHPHYQQMFAPKLDGAKLSEEDKELYLFMLAARWPDDIKRLDYEPKHDNWHYINFTFNTDSASVHVESITSDTVNIITAYHTNIEILKSNGAAQDKAIALCWLLHLIGDIHQPLHTSKLISVALPAPDGDRGGNRLFIRAEQDGKPLNLHSFWDGLILGSQDFRQADNVAVTLKNLPVYKRKRLKDLKDKQFENWAEKESFELAKKYVYQEGNVTASINREEAPVIAPDYITTAKTIAEKRIVLAGYRIAEELKALY